nr:MAG TPA: hypothetical protein [Caudoviricetes sp.]
MGRIFNILGKPSYLGYLTCLVINLNRNLHIVEII